MLKCAGKLIHLPESVMTYLTERKNEEELTRSKEEAEGVAAEGVESNILHISLAGMEEYVRPEDMAPLACKSCNAYLNTFSDIDQDDLETWRCEFCGEENKVDLKKIANPKNEVQIFTLESEKKEQTCDPVQIVEEEKVEKSSSKEYESSGVEEKKDSVPNSEDISVVFCIDVSSSMDSQITEGVTEKLKYMKKKGKMTRLEAVKLAIDQQLHKMLDESPNVKVGFVLFNSEVSILGDCIGSKVSIPKCFLSDR